MTMRYLLGGTAAGVSADDLLERASASGGLELVGPVTAYRVSGATRTKDFLLAYATDFHGQLPVATLDLQKFEDKTWMVGGIFITDRVVWDKCMGWWGGPGAGTGSEADNTRDYFITGLRLSGQGPNEGRPDFTPLDFLFNHLPALTPSQVKAQDGLAQMTEDAFWDKVLPDTQGAAGTTTLREAAHTLLSQLRQELEHDYRFARKYGYILFQGDKFGRSPTIMEE
jgi:hypothetical protein